jgi:hypothetical protein
VFDLQRDLIRDILKARGSGGLVRRRKLHQHNFFLLLLASWLQYQVQVDDLMRKKKKKL